MAAREINFRDSSPDSGTDIVVNDLSFMGVKSLQNRLTYRHYLIQTLLNGECK